MIFVAYAFGVATPPLLYLLYLFLAELPTALDQVACERRAGTSRKASLLRPWAWYLLVAMSRTHRVAARRRDALPRCTDDGVPIN